MSISSTGRPAAAEPVLGAPGVVSLAVLVAGTIALGLAYGPSQGALFLIGGALGISLYHAAFGFTSAWRVFIAEGRGRGLRVQMLLLALAVILFFPVLSNGVLFGHEVRGNISPAGIGVIAGAFMFGIGMQLGGGCASGTLFTAGGGNARMLITLFFFIVGSVIATVNFDWWVALPSLPPTAMFQTLGAVGGIAVSLAIFAAIAAITVYVERRRHGALEQPGEPSRHGLARYLRGPWPLVAGAIALVALNFATLAIAGRPWGITSAFALWGAKGAQLIGIDPTAWAYWQQPANAKALSQSVFADVTSVMDFGIIAGAMLAAALAGRFAPSFSIPRRSVAAAVLGGLLLGYGARIAYGCNIGAYFSGIASGSLHGYLWAVAAFAGNVIGVRLRPWFFEERLMARTVDTSVKGKQARKGQVKRKRGKSVLVNLMVGVGLTTAALMGASVITVATAVKPANEVRFQTALLAAPLSAEHLVGKQEVRALDVAKFSRLPGRSAAEPKTARLAGAELAALAAVRPQAEDVRQALNHALTKAARHAEHEQQFAALATNRPSHEAIRTVVASAMTDLVVVAPRGDGALPDLVQDAQTVATVAELKDMKPVEMASLEDTPVEDVPSETASAEVTEEVAALAQAQDYSLPKAGPLPVIRPSAGTRGDDGKPAAKPSALAAIAAVAPQKPGRSADAEKPTVLAFAKPDNPMRQEPSAPAAPAPKWPGIGSKVAIYDITGGVVHMPNGTKLEAHSGIGSMRDNPKFTHVKMRGPTPPGTYKLSMRESLFHGVAAIRLTPVDGRAPQGRTGLLAHSYLLRVRGDSHGCVAFAEYDRFLKAFQRGEITHMVIVPRWDGRRPGGAPNGGFLAKLFGGKDA
eukprot:g7722.t1